MRVFLAAFAHETNSFSPLPTTLRSFRDDILYLPGDDAARDKARGFAGYADLLAVAAARGDEVVAGMCAWAQPAGPVARDVYEGLRDELLAELRAAGPVDAVLLVLHGAMMADGYTDCEGDLLRHVRAQAGPAMPVGALLDLHGNVTPAMLGSGALLVACKEYPHTDYAERSAELYALLAAMAAGAPAPRMLMRRVPMLGLFGTTEGPMRAFVRRLQEAERQPGIRSVSAMHGFPWSDAVDTGAAVLVAHDASAAQAAEELAARLAGEMFGLRGAAAARLPLDEALDAALAIDGACRPVVLADGADNPGGGAAGDSTFVLRALLDRGIDNAALGMIWDPQAAAIAADAGAGARLPLRIGGKVGPRSGAPVDVEAEVLCVRGDARQPGLGGKGSDALGLAVAIRAAGIDIVLNTVRQQVFSPECFTELGIDVRARRLVVVKSTQHFRAGFDPIAAATVYCDTPGTLSVDIAGIPYRAIARPIWPLDPDLGDLPILANPPNQHNR
ncbi:M81 family metallopeptidase [Pseudoduganella lutea]|uniref:Microcystinase C n=1 Tax=Pseudoduganella lutea TaxID=321985 RepID=A0A4P6L1Z6_9BURK|nr:M81 family metallopeptidase [Pseudoduganella lutea]QBE65407.1 M81 family peptidase [Pseudoduganella lutea]